MSKWLNPKIDEMPNVVNILAFIDIKYQKNKEDIADLEISESAKRNGFITCGYASDTQFHDLIHPTPEGDNYFYDIEAVVAWMPLPTPPLNRRKK